MPRTSSQTGGEWRETSTSGAGSVAFPTTETAGGRLRLARGHFPNETSALKVLYLTIRTKDERGSNVVGRVRNWKQVLNTLVLHYGDRINH